jgi:glyoxylase-like metal-dependent hydrolase (beta-lactamase superfamily II)
MSETGDQPATPPNASAATASTERVWAVGDWQQLADGVFRLVAEPATVNIGLVVGPDAALIVDTGSSPAQGAEIHQAMARVTDRPLAGVVVTHDHFDHAYGLAGFADVRTIGHETLAETLRSDDAAKGARELGFDPDELAVPEALIGVADAVELGGGRVVEIIHLGFGHSQGDLIVSVSDPAADGFAGVIFAGDLVESAPSIDAAAPYFGSDSSVDQWSWTLDRLYNLARPGVIIVPGHGEPVDRDFVRDQRDAVDAVRLELQRLLEAGVAEEDALEQGNWPFPAKNVAPVISAGYAELRAVAAAAQPDAGGRPTLPLA